MSNISELKLSDVVVIATEHGGVIGSLFIKEYDGELFNNDDTTSVALVVDVVGIVEACVILNCGNCPAALEVSPP